MKNIDLRLDREDLEAAHLVMEALGGVMRYVGDPTIDPARAVSTQFHTYSTLHVAEDIFSQLPPSSELEALARKTYLSTITHDWGELVTEFFSFAEEVRLAPAAIEQVERKIATFAIAQAYEAVRNGTQHEFHGMIAQMRADTKGMAGSLAAQAVEVYIEERGMPELPADYVTRADQWLYFYTRAENEKLRKNDFVGSLVKVVERIDGKAFLNDNAGQDNGSSYGFYPSYHVIKDVQRLEGVLADLYAAANTDVQRAVAVEVLKRSYREIARNLEMAQEIIDLQAKPDSEAGFSATLDEKMKSWKALTDGLRQEMENIMPHAPRYIRSQDLANRYHAAAETGYIPKPGDSLLKPIMPQELVAAASRPRPKPCF